MQGSAVQGIVGRIEKTRERQGGCFSFLGRVTGQASGRAKSVSAQSLTRACFDKLPSLTKQAASFFLIIHGLVTMGVNWRGGCDGSQVKCILLFISIWMACCIFPFCSLNLKIQELYQGSSHPWGYLAVLCEGKEGGSCLYTALRMAGRPSPN